MWIPDFPRSNAPLYTALADSIEAAIGSGELHIGDQLPPQRDLAKALGITVGTVNRAYVEARRRGYVDTKVGAGTYVRTANTSEVYGRITPKMKVVLSQSLERLARSSDLPNTLMGSRRSEHGRVEEAGSKWLRTAGLNPKQGTVLSFAGAQHAISSIFASLLKFGDTVICEELTYPGVIRLAAMHGVRLIPARIDAEGLVPSHVEELCLAHHPKMIYVVPNLQVPTLAVMGQERRAELARIATQFDALVLEDDSVSALMTDPNLFISEIAPERSIFISDPADTLCPALRLAYVLCPPRLADALIQGKRTTLVAGPSLDAAVISDWIWEGAHEALLAEKRADHHRRFEIASSCLAQHNPILHPAAQSIWFPLPDDMKASWLCSKANSVGVDAFEGDAFAVDRNVSVAGVSLSLVSCSDYSDLRQNLLTVSRVLARDLAVEIPPFFSH